MRTNRASEEQGRRGRCPQVGDTRSIDALRASVAIFSLMLAGTVALAPDARAASASPALARDGMVVSSEANATRAGVAMLERGGNAIDAAVATAFAISVTQPFSTGIGGGAFALVRLADGRVFALDTRETAPAAATEDMYVRPGVPEYASVAGGLAVATPGLVAGLAELQERHGTLPLREVIAPAVQLAREGFAIAPYHARMIGFMRRRITPERAPETAGIQFPPVGVVAQPGWRLVQRDLANTLEAIGKNGASAFHEGPIAEALAAAAQQSGGILTTADLAAYRPKWREALRGRYRDLEVISFPPPSSGGAVLIQALKILEEFDLAERGAGSSASLHLVSEAMKLAFADRAVYMGDADFVEVPIARLISDEHAAAQRARINPPWYRRAPWTWGRSEVAMRLEAPGLEHNDSGTTHLSVTDAAGNAVAMTKTINTPYGSGVTAPGTGVILNNEMDDFSKAPNEPNSYGLIDTRGANAIAPGKRPLSSMTPTILLRDGELFMVTGSPGGPRIISTTLLSILNVVDYGMDVKAAVSAPRFHHQWQPDKLRVEPETPADVIEGLRARGHDVDVSSRRWSAAEAIVIDRENGWHMGGNDPRRDGLALGVNFEAR